jgi:hypothetical protein
LGLYTTWIRLNEVRPKIGYAEAIDGLGAV